MANPDDQNVSNILVAPRLPPRPSSHQLSGNEVVKPPLPPRPSFKEAAPLAPSNTETTDEIESTDLPQYSPTEASTSAPLPDEEPSVEPTESVLPLPLHETREPTEAELREEYDNQEIEKYLLLFSAVNEVRASGGDLASLSATVATPAPPTKSIPLADGGEEPIQDSLADELNNSVKQNTPPGAPSSLSERIARDYILPILPTKTRPPPSQFSIGRMRVAAQRMYVIVDMGYLPLALHMANLSTWKDFNLSARYCAAFWILWGLDFLMPSFFAGLLFLLIKKRVAPYPSREQLRMHVEKMAHADKFGKNLQGVMLRPSNVGVQDVWELGRMLPGVFKKRKGKKGTLDSTKTADVQDEIPDAAVQSPIADVDAPPDLESITVVNAQTAALAGISELADIHERVFNLYMWKNPGVSRGFGFCLAALFLVTTFVPTKYLVKLALGLAGFAFFHLVPILIALGPEGRARLPPPLEEVPTDAEVALELIAKRVAQGLPVLPPKRRKQKHSSSVTSTSLSNSPNLDSASIRSGGDEEEKQFSWSKWGERVAEGKNLASTAQRLFTNKSEPHPSTEQNAKSYPAQHKRGPGLITITSTHLYFSMLHSLTPVLSIPISECTGIKKKGVLKGLTITWNNRDESGNVVEQEDVFRWVGGRDEVFARLLGSDGRRWLNL